MSHRESSPTDHESSYKLTEAWVRASGHVLNSIVVANRAALASFGLAGDHSDADAFESKSDRWSDADWSFDRSVESADELGVGDAVTFTKSIDDKDILAFARASGNTNSLHLNNKFAEQTRFRGRIVHGSLVSGVVSAALARLPGQVIYLSQETQYLNPVRPGDTVTAEVEVTEILGEQRYRLSTVATVDGGRVLEGEAVVLVDESQDCTPSFE